MATIPEVMEILDKIEQIHKKKNEDYAANDKPFENFQRSAMLGNWFNVDSDKSFAILIGTKLARLSTLLNSRNEPNNESIEDSFTDLATYCILWQAYYKRYDRLSKGDPAGPGEIHGWSDPATLLNIDKFNNDIRTGAAKGHMVPTRGCSCFICTRLRESDLNIKEYY